ncbi:MAG: hypothetical protein MK165_14860 [Pirellulaceae bacterium]|nr:hypothetical protein [Pirellulaceae bacterium]
MSRIPASQAESSLSPSGSHQQRPAHSQGVTTGIVIAFLVALVSLPVVIPGISSVISEISSERARWHLAAAHDKRLNGDYTGSLRDLEKALAAAPEDQSILVACARERMRAKDFEGAVDLTNQLVQQSPELFLGFRAQIHLEAGNATRAIADLAMVQSRQATVPRVESAQLLNTLAYARSLANEEVEQGLIEANRAVDLQGGEVDMLDTFGYFLHLNGEHQQALEWLERAVQRTQGGSTRNPPTNVGGEPDPEKSVVPAVSSHRLGLIYHHQSIAWDALGQKAEAESARALASEHGLDDPLASNWLLSWLPLPEPEAVNFIEVINFNAAVMDTRGFLYYRAGDYAAALWDLGFAIEQVTALAPNYYEFVRSHETDLREIREQEDQFDHSVAVLFYHRMLILEALDRTVEAAEDRRRITEYGYPADATLF